MRMPSDHGASVMTPLLVVAEGDLDSMRILVLTNTAQHEEDPESALKP